MKKQLLTDKELMARSWPEGSRELHVEQGTILTPSAWDFLRENDIKLCFDEASKGYGSMTVTPLESGRGGAVYRELETGRELSSKGEDMTHLRGNILVPKTHPRIKFRGKLDSLMAQVIEAQLTASESGSRQTAGDLDEILTYLRKIMSAEVKDQPLESISFMGMDSERIRYVSHHVRESFGMDHPSPDYRMGRLCASLNSLRTAVRELELTAAETFSDPQGGCSRMDILEGLNRLSSCVYILFCRNAAGTKE